MLVIHHRRNLVDELKQTPCTNGIEIDIRNHGADLFVVHDPFRTDAVLFSQWIKNYNHKFLIVNVKEEGLEPKVCEILAENNVNDFFILDESFPFIRKYAMQGLSNFAVRISEFESIETAINLANYLRAQRERIDWLWVDCFSGHPWHVEHASFLLDAGFKLCLVSPELHYVNYAECENLVFQYQEKLCNCQGVAARPDMVCTKFVDLWEEYAAKV
jgi:hypothetical protein